MLPAYLPNNNRSRANAINLRDVAVGHVFQNQGGDTRAFLYTAAGQMVSLNDYVDPASGWTLEVATGINNRSEIVGYGSKGGLRRAF